MSFSVWAPGARGISVVGDFNGWDGRLHPMRCMGSSGIWEIFIPEIGEGMNYKFEIRTHDGRRLLKADPYAFATEKLSPHRLGGPPVEIPLPGPGLDE